MTRSTNMEHVEVLRDLSEVCRAAIKAGDWKVDGACDPDAVLRRADAAIAALSAPKPSSVSDNAVAVNESAPVNDKPESAQPVAWQFQDREGNWHGFVNEQHRLNTIEDGSWPIRPLYAHPPPSAPVGVEEVVRKVCERLDKVADYAHTIDDETVVVALPNLPAVLDRALSEALSQQPAACVGCEGNPAPENNPCAVCGQQPAAVDEAMVERGAKELRDLHREFGDGADLPEKIAREIAEAVVVAALAGQQENDDD